MKKASMSKDDQNIPELRREQLGAGVRGKYLGHLTQGSNTDRPKQPVDRRAMSVTNR